MTTAIIDWISNFFRSPKDRQPNLGRRQVIASAVAGLGAGMLFPVQPLAGKRNFNPDLVRPPGSAAESDFLGTCIRCGECMKVCPTNVIQPAMLEGGLEGLWTPVLKTKYSYCEYKCTMCTQVCPTDAIRPLPLPEKQKVRIGLAAIDTGRCLPYAYARQCQVCLEHCPLPEKAIWTEDAVVKNAAGSEVSVKLPRVNADLCIGCGICENKCPVSDQAAIRITSVGEDRQPGNEFRSADRYAG
jgi:MauM/NapG family ferredoxin protein